MNGIVVRDSMRNEVAKQHRVEDDMKEAREQLRMDISKLNTMINQAEEQMVQLRKRYESAVQHRNDRWVAATGSPSGQVRCGGICRSSASPRPPCQGTPSSSVWQSSRQTPGPPCPYPSDRPSSGIHSDRRQARHARIVQIGLHLTQP